MAKDNIHHLPPRPIPVNSPFGENSSVDPTGGIWMDVPQDKLDAIWKYAEMTFRKRYGIR